MTSAEILVDAFGRVQETVHEVVRGLTSSQLAERLGPDANSIAWLVWHLTRVQDDHVADAFGVPQVWTEYGKRFELPLEPYDTGYGHTSEQVARVTVPSADLLTGTRTRCTSRPSGWSPASRIRTWTGSWTRAGTRR
jgi:Protein of unknown function (DUF664).